MFTFRSMSCRGIKRGQGGDRSTRDPPARALLRGARYNCARACFPWSPGCDGNRLHWSRTRISFTSAYNFKLGISAEPAPTIACRQCKQTRASTSVISATVYFGFSGTNTFQRQILFLDVAIIFQIWKFSGNVLLRWVSQCCWHIARRFPRSLYRCTTVKASRSRVVYRDN